MTLTHSFPVLIAKVEIERYRIVCPKCGHKNAFLAPSQLESYRGVLQWCGRCAGPFVIEPTGEVP